tara:strand:+ start:3993 stop:4352 length:360 start_codon:yes stop_codon:yes gene_type:complete
MPNVFGFREGEARRILRAANSHSLSPSNRNPEASEFPLGDRECWIAKSPSGGVPARSGDTPGLASCILYEIDDNGELAATSGSIDVYNIASSSVAGDTYLVIETEQMSGKTICIVEDCG